MPYSPLPCMLYQPPKRYATNILLFLTSHTHPYSLQCLFQSCTKISKDIWKFQISNLSQPLWATCTHTTSSMKNFAMHLIRISLAAGCFHCFLWFLFAFFFFGSHLRRVWLHLYKPMEVDEDSNQITILQAEQTQLSVNCYMLHILVSSPYPLLSQLMAFLYAGAKNWAQYSAEMQSQKSQRETDNRFS